MNDILFLGNGINRAYEGDSWKELLQSIKTVEDDLEGIKCPEPLKAILATENDVKSCLGNYLSRIDAYEMEKKKRETYENLLSLGFSDIITTNYSYELEISSLQCNCSKNQIKKMSKSSKKRVEPKYLINSYNVINGNTRVWHIHGEYRKPDSIILSHYYYSGLLYRIIDYDKKTSYHRSNSIVEINKCNSWIDAFLVGNVHILGYGAALSEIDFWWLLYRKANEDSNGKVYFYTPQKDINSVFIRLMKQIKNKRGEYLVNVIPTLVNMKDNKEDWVKYYSDAINKMRKEIENEKGN